VQDLLDRAALPRVVAIGETGLDYYGMEDRKGGRSIADLEWQRERFRTHIRAARACGKPLVIHTRSASDDTLAILREEGEDGAGNRAGGVFHCFTESMQVARAALDLGYYISFSGIITFKNAQDLRDVVAFVPMDRMLDRDRQPLPGARALPGQDQQPVLCALCGPQMAQCKGIAVERWRQATSRNFERCSKEWWHDASPQRAVGRWAGGGLPLAWGLVRRFFHGHFARRPCRHHRLAAPGLRSQHARPQGAGGFGHGLETRVRQCLRWR
jgi:TatD DNase family protein